MEQKEMANLLWKASEALTDLLDGQKVHDLVDQTGLSASRCEEIVNLKDDLSKAFKDHKVW